MNMRELIEAVQPILEVKVGDVDGVQYWMDPSFAGVVSLAKEADLKGLVSGRGFVVWDAFEANHDRMAHAMAYSEMGIYITREGKIAEATEWQDQPYAEGKGIRLYWQDFLDPQQIPPLKRLVAKITPQAA